MCPDLEKSAENGRITHMSSPHGPVASGIDGRFTECQHDRTL